MYTELWIDRGVLIRCGNPGGAFDDKEMRRNFGMREDAILLEGYDDEREADLVYNMMIGNQDPRKWFAEPDNLTLVHLHQRMLDYIRAMHRTQTSYYVFAIVNDCPAWDKSFISKSRAKKYKQDLEHELADNARNDAQKGGSGYPFRIPLVHMREISFKENGNE